MRSKSSLSRKRVKKDPAFAETRRHAEWMGEASVIASKVYRQLYTGRKNRTIYQRLTGKAFRLLKQGKNKDEVWKLLNTEAKLLIEELQTPIQNLHLKEQNMQAPIALKSILHLIEL